MAVYRLDIAYDGSGYRGYARQAGQRTIQGDLESALGTYLKVPVKTAVAGRTDAGVHARGQVVSFEHDGEVDPPSLLRAINGIVGPELAVMAVTTAPDDFNARFSATWRRYRYRMDTGPARDPLSRHLAWHVSRELDLEAMRGVCSAFIGEHDFTAFCKSIEGKSNVRRVSDLTLDESGHFLDLWIQANAFCHQMVRSIVGYFYDVGRGFSDGAEVADVIAEGDRSRVATVAPPHGLVLWDVGYD